MSSNYLQVIRKLGIVDGKKWVQPKDMTDHDIAVNLRLTCNKYQYKGEKNTNFSLSPASSIKQPKQKAKTPKKRVEVRKKKNEATGKQSVTYRIFGIPVFKKEIV